MTVISALSLVLLSLPLAASPAWAGSPGVPQDKTEPQISGASGQSACTDLSRKVPLPCPDAAGTPARLPEAGTDLAPIGGRNRSPSSEPASPKAPAAPLAPGEANPHAATAADSPAVSVPPASHARSMELSLPLNLLRDEKRIWNSPARLRLQDVQWLAPLLGVTAISIASDTSIERELPTSPNFIRRSNDFSNYGAAAFAAATGGAYLWSRVTDNAHLRETAILSGEAALNTVALTYAIKSITQRRRPLEGDGRGSFWSSGDSFPSEHAAAAWSMATVIAHQYPGPLPKLLAYGGAAAISAARVTARKHFVSDALVGSALGWFVGREVYERQQERWDSTLYGTFERRVSRESPPDPGNMGAAYVPLDSWVYPAIERLAAMGYIRSAFAGLRPWTRLEVVRLLDEAALQLQAQPDQDHSGAARLLRSLQAEFTLDADRAAGAPNVGAEIESIYTRVTGISGPPLTDGYHFGQTIINDYGRPYQEGANVITGFSARAEAGPLAFYFRGEYQHAPTGPVLPLSARTAIATADRLPLPPATPAPGHDDFRLLDTYLAFSFNGYQFSFGRQSLWWGPGQGGPMMFSNNIVPVDMIRFSRVSPTKLPSILGWLGPVRTEAFLGRLAEYQFIFGPSGLTGEFGVALTSQPFIHGQKISFKPTPNFEFGVSRTTVFGGAGYPFTTHSFFRSLLSSGNKLAGDPDKPGDRRSGFDFSYRIPKLRNWLTFYGDGFTEDEYSPIGYPDRSIWRAGLYLSHVPGVPKLDLRTEGTYSDNPIGGAVGPGYYYANSTWRDGYRNRGELIGNWIGRAGQGAQAWATYHFGPRNSLELGYRHQKVSQDFVEGGTVNDVSATANWTLRRELSVQGRVQYERWKFPVLSPAAQTDITASFQLMFHPAWRLGK